MKALKVKPPADRSAEQLWHHYEVESGLARQLMSADRAERGRIFETMYDTLFREVPDHPRLTRRDDPARTAEANRAKMAIYGRFFTPDTRACEFAPGDCEFALKVAPRVKSIVAVDISDQRQPGRDWPQNFELVIYDGYNLPQIEPGSIDVVYSDQFLEHLHPEDAESHLQLVRQILRPGGAYVIRTPHAMSGPWDVSRYFCDVAEGFHLKEWTYGELAGTLRRLGYTEVQAMWSKRGRTVRVPLGAYEAVESLGRGMSRASFRRIAKYVAPMVFCVAIK